MSLLNGHTGLVSNRRGQWGKERGGGEDKHKKGDKNEKPIIQKVVEKREWDRDNKAK